MGSMALAHTARRGHAEVVKRPGGLDPEALFGTVARGAFEPGLPRSDGLTSMKRVVSLLFFFLVVSVVAARVMTTGERRMQVRAELAWRGWRGFECIEPAEAA